MLDTEKTIGWIELKELLDKLLDAKDISFIKKWTDENAGLFYKHASQILKTDKLMFYIKDLSYDHDGKFTEYAIDSRPGGESVEYSMIKDGSGGSRVKTGIRKSIPKHSFFNVLRYVLLILKDGQKIQGSLEQAKKTFLDEDNALVGELQTPFFSLMKRIAGLERRK